MSNSCPPIRQGKSLKIRYSQYDYDHSSAQKPSNKSTNQRQARKAPSSYSSVIFSCPPLSDATHTNTAAAHLISMPARQSRSSLPFGQLADIVQDTRRAKGRVSLGTQTPFCRPACFLPSPPACGCRGPHETAYHGSLSGTVGSQPQARRSRSCWDCSPFLPEGMKVQIWNSAAGVSKSRMSWCLCATLRGRRRSAQLPLPVSVWPQMKVGADPYGHNLLPLTACQIGVSEKVALSVL